MAKEGGGKQHDDLSAPVQVTHASMAFLLTSNLCVLRHLLHSQVVHLGFLTMKHKVAHIHTPTMGRPLLAEAFGTFISVAGNEKYGDFFKKEKTTTMGILTVHLGRADEQLCWAGLWGQGLQGPQRDRVGLVWCR